MGTIVPIRSFLRELEAEVRRYPLTTAYIACALLLIAIMCITELTE